MQVKPAKRALRAVSHIALASAAMVLSMNVCSAAWPDNKPITMIVPYGAGGASDTLGRMVALKLSKTLKQSIIVENKPGAGSMLGSQYVAHAEPDGYTLLLGSISNVVNNFFYRKPLYDLQKDLEPVSELVSVPNFLAVSKSMNVHSVADIIKLAREKPDSLSCSTSGIGSSPYLSCELLKLMAGVKIINVPFKSGTEAIQAVIGKQTSMVFANEALPFIKSGQIHALGVSTPERTQYLPDAPAIAETLPGYDVTAWYGVWAPAGTPKPIVQKISAAIAQLTHDPDALRIMKSLGATPKTSTPDEFRTYVDAEMVRWRKVTSKMHITLQ